jgi:predicted transcriptional regulator
MMSPLLEQAIARAVELPEEMQESAAQFLLDWLEQQKRDPDDEDTQEILAGIREGLLDIKNGNVMTLEELDAFMASDEYE